MVSALFVRKDSIYKAMGLDCWDSERNALLWPGGNAGIFHPPCRGWGRLRKFSVATEEEKELAVWSVNQVRRWGGVVEHPASSDLWRYCNLPLGNQVDQYGGFTLSVNLHWFGFPAEKKTYLYIVGCLPRCIPAYPLSFDAITHKIRFPDRRGRSGEKNLPKSQRDVTPVLMATWLISLCEKIQDVRLSGCLDL